MDHEFHLCLINQQATRLNNSIDRLSHNMYHALKGWSDLDRNTAIRIIKDLVSGKVVPVPNAHLSHNFCVIIDLNIVHN